MKAISLDSAAIVTERSRRTWQRRAADGQIQLLADDAKGRSMASIDDVAPDICIPMDAEDRSVLVQADGGDAASQSDIGQLFASHGKTVIALHFLRAAADKNDADAMQILGQMYARGEGVERDENTAMMWIAKAASLGHVIAKAQIQGLMPRK